MQGKGSDRGRRPDGQRSRRRPYDKAGRGAFDRTENASFDGSGRGPDGKAERKSYDRSGRRPDDRDRRGSYEKGKHKPYNKQEHRPNDQDGHRSFDKAEHRPHGKAGHERDAFDRAEPRPIGQGGHAPRGRAEHGPHDRTERRPFERGGQRSGGRGPRGTFDKETRGSFSPDEHKPFSGKSRPADGTGDRRFRGDIADKSADRARPAEETAASGRPEGAGAERRRPSGGPGRSATARDAALTAVRGVLHADAFASQALDRALASVHLTPEDRRLAAGMFYFTIENHLYLDYVLSARLETRPDPLVWDILQLAAAQLLFMDRVPDHAAVDEAVKQVRANGRSGMEGLVNAVLRGLIRARDEGEMGLPDPEEDPAGSISVRCSLARPAVERLISAYGREMAERIAAWTPSERTVTLRPNRLQCRPDELESMLTKDGIVWRRGVVPDALIVTGGGSLAEHPGYRRGDFSIQSEGSMLAALAVEARPGMQILDACAAPGGKTCLMAERMGSSGRVYAWDVYPHRVELIRAAAKRLGLDNVRPSEHDARKAMPAMEAAMDAVLVDAPCSGLGVMADKPDIRFRITDEEIDSLLPLQAAILDSCARAVRPGGLLVYSTCTILPEENARQVEAFLERHPEFEPDSGIDWLPEPLRGSAGGGMLQLLPSEDSVEGFFIARLRRRRP